MSAAESPLGGPAGQVLHGSIRLIEDLCTSCMICARECPAWCIRIDSHLEPIAGLPPRRSAGGGSRDRTSNVLDRFEIDWALCMYCGICVDQCPFDALEWAGPHVAPAADLASLVHGIDQLSRPEAR